MSIMVRSGVYFALACVLGLRPITTGTALANNKVYDTSLEDRPCNILTADMVATTLNLPTETLLHPVIEMK